MEHPFIHSLGDKSIDDLQGTISSLNGKLSYAYRTGNTALISQLRMAIDSYQAEYRRKMDDMINRQNIQGSIRIQK